MSELDVAARFDESAVSTLEPAAAAPTEPVAPYDPNDPASIESYISAQAQAGAEQRLATIAEQLQQQQAAVAAYEQARQEWLGDPWSEGYEERLAELQVDDAVRARLAQFGAEYRPLLEQIEHLEAAKQAEAAEQQLEAVHGLIADTLGALAEEHGSFDMDRAYQNAEQMTAQVIGQLVAQGQPLERVNAELIRAGFPDAILRDAALMQIEAEKAANGGIAPQPTAPPVLDELGVARRFGAPRSPSEAISAVEREAAASPAFQRELARMEAKRAPLVTTAKSEVEVARAFMDRKRAVATT
ncbi:MAG TPA: hypothetical protein VFM96_10170 [Gaiellaceae bacterium]|nr:hypothetical protein [Gaiellaceae bacterium]